MAVAIARNKDISTPRLKELIRYNCALVRPKAEDLQQRDAMFLLLAIRLGSREAVALWCKEKNVPEKAIPKFIPMG